MKFLFFFVIVLISTAYTQSDEKKSYSFNPDGEYMSFHLTPYLTTGKIFDQKLDAEMCFKVEIIAPMTNTVSLKVFYDYMNTTYSNKVNSFFTGENPIQINKIGATISFYLN